VGTSSRGRAASAEAGHRGDQQHAHTGVARGHCLQGMHHSSAVCTTQQRTNTSIFSTQALGVGGGGGPGEVGEQKAR
jgi:hypothetical protein